MLVDPQQVSSGAIYRLMVSVIVPRPIAFVSTVSKGGVFNVAPFSYFNAITNHPPLVGISIGLRAGGGVKDTLRNIRETQDFVVNIVDEPLFERMVHTSGDWSPETSEFELTGLTPVASERVKSPRVGESPVSLECTLHREVELGDSAFVVGEIRAVHVADEVITDGRVDPAKLRPVARLGGDAYALVREILHRARPKVPTATD